MFKVLSKSILVFILITYQYSIFADDQSDATNAAHKIVNLLQNKQYETLWDSKMSAFFKSTVTKDSFLANMTLGRSQLGEAVESKFIDMAYSQTDPATGIEGEIYAFNFLNTYSFTKAYERIVVIKEDDGEFRLAGLWGAPTQ